MPRFILINEVTKCACFVSQDEIAQLVDVRKNPGGYSDVDRCVAMITSPAPTGYMAFPLTLHGMQHSIHVEGRMDLSGHGLTWREPGHRCTRQCAVQQLIAKDQMEILRKMQRR